MGESKDIYLDWIEPGDIDRLLTVYNSHPVFLAHHIHQNAVNGEWIRREIDNMRANGFLPCKVIENTSHEIIGLMDVKIAAETYLSLLMIHQNHAHRGFGTQAYKALEDYACTQGSRIIRIDVIRDYSDEVMNFWMQNGFHAVKDIVLTWSTVISPAVMMTKVIPCPGRRERSTVKFG